jgi:hypothetical protein
LKGIAMTRKILGILVFILTACQAVTLDSQVVPVFQKYKELNIQFLQANSANAKTEREKVETYMYREYTEALNLLEAKYCSEPNENVLDEFISVLIATSNSAYETPSYVLGKLYICQPNLVVNKIHALTPEDKRYIVQTLDWGFQNATYQHEDEIQNYTELLNQLKSLKAEVE